MLDDESKIRTLIERWARAAQAGDIEGVLVDHTADIVMFDVPPPEAGARGIEAYRQTWPPFFKAQEKDGVFEIVSLDVTDGADVAFAYALLRCGTQEELKKRPRDACVSPWVYARRKAGGSLPTSITPSRWSPKTTRGRPAWSGPTDRRTILAEQFQIRGRDRRVGPLRPV